MSSASGWPNPTYLCRRRVSLSSTKGPTTQTPNACAET